MPQLHDYLFILFCLGFIITIGILTDTGDLMMGIWVIVTAQFFTTCWIVSEIRDLHKNLGGNVENPKS